MTNNKNILIACVLSAIILIGWTWLYEKPRMEKLQQEQELALQLKKSEPPIIAKSKSNDLDKVKIENDVKVSNLSTIAAPREDLISDSQNQRIKILNKELEGSIYLRGAIFDDLTLINYRKTIDPKSPEVVILSPSASSERYFADFGWISSDNNIDLPKPTTLWQSSGKELTPNKPLTLSWKNKQNILFQIHVALDENYMFSISQQIKNLSGAKITLAPYGRVSRSLNELNKSNYILHEGPIGAFDNILQEFNYKDLIKENNKSFPAKTGWIGITDKYWLTSMIPDKKLEFQGNFSHEQNNNNSIYNTEFIGKEFVIENGAELKFEHHLFAGAKKVSLLDQYSKQYDIARFDRAVDFGWYYFLTKPFFFILKLFSNILGNYGLAILAMTVLIKLIMFPLANKSYLAMDKIKKLHPKIEEIRKADHGDRMQINKDIMELYKKEKVNPASGCLPMLIQIPVFFSLYKVLYVTIDMRHTPFYGWIKDLSAPDPTSIFNLFGLLPFETHGIFMIGIWPILMGATMILQQKLGPQMSDPAQAKVMKILPFVLIFVFAAFPAGLLIYWTWSNILSITQQWFITHTQSRKASKKHAN